MTQDGMVPLDPAVVEAAHRHAHAIIEHAEMIRDSAANWWYWARRAFALSVVLGLFNVALGLWHLARLTGGGP